MEISISMTEEEKMMVESYARSQGLSAEELLKQSLFENIREEYIRCVCDDIHDAYVKSGGKNLSLAELFKEINS